MMLEVAKRVWQDKWEIILALGCPVALAFVIGVAMGTQSAITVHNWFKSEQALRPMLSLDQLESVVLT